MGFRFRRSFKVIPGVRINLGKRGPSVSVGMRGARVTMGPAGTRASVGIPGTGASYTTRIDRPNAADRRMSAISTTMLAVPTVLLVVGVVASIIVGVAKSLEWFFVIFTVTLILCGPWLAIASNASRARESEDTSIPPPLPATPPPLPRKYADIMAEAQRRKAERAEADALLQEQERTVHLLNEARCFYRNENEQIGPVSFWRVRELIEMELLTPDVQVIAEGSDYWRTYAEWEFIVVPPRDQSTFAKLSKAAHMSCFYLDQGREVGPISLLAIFHYIRSGKLSPEVHVRAITNENWVPASQI